MFVVDAMAVYTLGAPTPPLLNRHAAADASTEADVDEVVAAHARLSAAVFVVATVFVAVAVLVVVAVVDFASLGAPTPPLLHMHAAADVSTDTEAVAAAHARPHSAGSVVTAVLVVVAVMVVPTAALVHRHAAGAARNVDEVRAALVQFPVATLRM